MKKKGSRKNSNRHQYYINYAKVSFSNYSINKIIKEIVNTILDIYSLTNNNIKNCLFM